MEQKDLLPLSTENIIQLLRNEFSLIFSKIWKLLGPFEVLIDKTKGNGFLEKSSKVLGNRLQNMEASTLSKKMTK